MACPSLSNNVSLGIRCKCLQNNGLANKALQRTLGTRRNFNIIARY